MNLPDGFSNFFPYIMVEGAVEFLSFLGRSFQAVELGRTERDGRLVNARVRIGTVAFMVSEAQPPLGAMPSSFYLFVEDADKVHARALANGSAEIFPPTDMPYGDRQSGVTDPFGNLWFISTRIVDEPYS